MNMRLIGAPKLKDVSRDMVDASCLHQHIVAVPDDRLFHANCEFSGRVTENKILMVCVDESIVGAQLREAKGTKARM